MNINKCMIQKNNSNFSDISKIKKKDIEKIFKKYGLVILRNFEIDEKRFFNFTKLFTKNYATETSRRIKTKNKRTNYVDLGLQKMSLHSEASFSPSWPEIVWFYGKNVSKKYGETTLCCGNELWQLLNIKTKTFLKSNLLKFKIRSDIKLKIKNKKWNLNKIGVFNEFIDKNGFINYENLMYAISHSKYDNKIYLASHIIKDDTDPTIISMNLHNGKKVPSKIINEIKEKAKLITYFHKWEKNDLLMIDNQRLMHGRNKILKNEIREILNIQTLVSNI